MKRLSPAELSRTFGQPSGFPAGLSSGDFGVVDEHFAGVDGVADEVARARGHLDCAGVLVIAPEARRPGGRAAEALLEARHHGDRVLAGVNHLRERRDAGRDEVLERERVKPSRGFVEPRLLPRRHRDGRGGARRVAQAVEVLRQPREVDPASGEELFEGGPCPRPGVLRALGGLHRGRSRVVWSWSVSACQIG